MKPEIQNFEDYERLYKESLNSPESFWTNIANTYSWKQPWKSLMSQDFMNGKNEWFAGAKLNICYNAIDRHLDKHGDSNAIIWEPNSPDDIAKTFTYKQLHDEVCKIANALKEIGITKGDRVCIYMPMVPELLFSLLACARIGAIHSVVFAGFSAVSLSERINDSSCKVILTSFEARRGSKLLNLKAIVDEALLWTPSIQKALVLNSTNLSHPTFKAIDLDWNSIVDKQSTFCEPEWMDAEDPLFILYTSGSTGKPKGVVHSCGGYMVYAGYSFRNVFQYKPGEVFFCTADIGWITGHSYLTYGPLLNGATTLMFEGVPNWPDYSRFWQIVDKHEVNIFYTAPTAIRSLMAAGTEPILGHSLESLRVLGSVGEPINEEAWHWYHEHIGKKKCPIVDTWWQTETGGIMISAIAGITPLKPGYATLPLPGIKPILVDANGIEIIGNDVEGNLCFKYSWPSIIRTTWGDHERCKQAYFSTYQGMYFTGDGCKRDIDGYYRITGRVDDVINVSGHRIGTAEVESAINESQYIVESAVVGYPHAIKGQGLYAYVVCDKIFNNEIEVIEDIIQSVNRIIGPIAKPDKIQIVTGLPKTRSGKIMRRILRKVAENEIVNVGDTSTLLDPQVVEEIIKGRK